MAEVINDIEALERFRAHLIQFNSDLAESFAAIRGHWRELGDVWRDDMYQLFGEALEEVTPGIELYLSSTEGHEAHLAALIEQLHGYLEAGYGMSRREAGSARRSAARREAARREAARAEPPRGAAAERRKAG
jgi:hypothetical protein